MIFQQFVARQLSKPEGIIGKFILGPIWNKRNAKLNDVTFSHLELRQDDRVLDIGFGGGYLLERIIPNVQQGLIAGIDVSPVMVENFRARFPEAIKSGHIDIQCGRAEMTPFPDGYFTKVSSVNSIFYWSDVEQGIAEIYRILKKEGRAVLTYTCKRDLEKKGFEQYGVRTYETEEVHQMLFETGFKDIREIRSEDWHREFFCMIGRK